MTHSDSERTSSSSSESFCLSSCSDYKSDFRAFLSNQPIETKPELTPEADPTIYSFAWSDSNPENPSNHSEFVSSSMSTCSVVNPRGAPPSMPEADTAKDSRRAPPTLPDPICWTSLTHPDIFQEYISAEGLGQQRGSSDDTPSVAIGDPWETTKELQLSKSYSNMAHIDFVNTNKSKIVSHVPSTWVSDHLFPNQRLPVPFNSDLVTKNKDLWVSRDLGQVGDHTFSKLPNLATEETAMDWLNGICRTLGVIHGLVPPTNSTNPASGNDQSNIILPDRIFDDGGKSKLLPGGFLKQKPNIVLIDRAVKTNLPPGARVRWPVVQALVEVTVKPNHLPSLMNMLLSKASNIFESQLHRRYILGLGFFGKGAEVKFFITLIDRAGALHTKASHLKGYDALTLARILFAFTFGSDELLGMDTRITINRLTGDPIQVLIDKQIFKFIQKIHCSPYLFTCGTRVYIVQDAHGHFHVFKDSWILATHGSSEIDHIKKISSIANAVGSTDARSRYLRRRFVAGDDHVNNTSEPRGYVTTLSPARIRRRVVSGPIGDPITSYRSRVECLQALIDIVDQLKFLHDECGLVHGDISISNVVIVRFLPSILAASDAAVYQLSTTACELSANSPPSESSLASTAITVNPLLFSSEDNTLKSWEMVQPTTDTGFPHSLGSGGLVIDFDYSRPKNTISDKTSGTVPYMSIELMNPLISMEHRLEHDLESLLLVILHIARFTCGPAASSINEVKSSFLMSQWHHENVVEMIAYFKKHDIFDLRTEPTKFITNYWAPFIPYLVQLIDIIYPKADRGDMTMTRNDKACDLFKKVLVEGLDQCKKLQEITPNYAAFVIKKRKNDAQDRGKTKQSRRRRNDDDAPSRPLPGFARVLSLSQPEASGSVV